MNANFEKDSQPDYIKLQRDCPAILIPNGIPITMEKGEHVNIMQELGGSFTLYYNGNLVRVDGNDADALGLEVPEQAAPVAKKSTKKLLAMVLLMKMRFGQNLRLAMILRSQSIL